MIRHTDHVISVHVTVPETKDVPRVMEVLSRTAAGLGLDGFHASVNIDRYEHDHEDEEVGP